MIPQKNSFEEYPVESNIDTSNKDKPKPIGDDSISGRERIMADPSGNDSKRLRRLQELTERLRSLGKERMPDQVTEDYGGNEKYNKAREELRLEQEKESAILKEAEEIRDRLLEKGDLSITKEQFNTYFIPEGQTGIHFKQQNVGDCGGLAALHALSCCDWFEFFVRYSSCRKSEKSWKFEMPLMNKNGRTVEISKRDISSQWNASFLNRGPLSGIDMRPRIGPIRALEGVQALEAAFIISNNKEYTKIIKGPISDTERRMVEGIAGDDVLMLFGGELFEKCGVEANFKTTSEAAKNITRNNRLSLLDEENMAHLNHYLENWDFGMYIATATPYVWADKKIMIKGTNKFFWPKHHYSISSVDAKKKTVTLGNPHDTSKPIEITFDQFKQCFTGLRAVKINSTKLLEKMKRIEGKET
jgi:hypothetical protein